jgi:hypothetical protein
MGTNCWTTSNFVINEGNVPVGVSTNNVDGYFTITPNPIRNVAQVMLKFLDSTTIEIIDINGKIVSTIAVNPQQFIYGLKTDLLPKGIYFVRVGKHRTKVTVI